MDDFDRIACSYDHTKIATVTEPSAFADPRFGFSWPADLTDKKTLDRVHKRNSTVVAELERLYRLDASSMFDRTRGTRRVVTRPANSGEGNTRRRFGFRFVPTFRQVLFKEK
jgi:hypothetical protein